MARVYPADECMLHPQSENINLWLSEFMALTPQKHHAFNRCGCVFVFRWISYICWYISAIRYDRNDCYGHHIHTLRSEATLYHKFLQHKPVRCGYL